MPLSGQPAVLSSRREFVQEVADGGRLGHLGCDPLRVLAER
jgi:hypothetical protein